MPASDAPARGGRLPAALVMIGLGLAPIAAILLAIGQSTTMLRVAAVLALVAVILIGVAVLLARVGGGQRTDVEDLVYDEVDALRDDVRDDIAHAAKATHRALADKIVSLNDTIEALRGQVEVLRAHVERGMTAPPVQHSHGVAAAHPATAPGVLRHTETVQVTTRQTMLVDADERGTVYGGGRPAEAPAPPAVPKQRRGEWRSSRPAPHEPARVEPEPDWRSSSRAVEGRRAEPDDTGESWTEQLLRERLERRQAEDADAERVTGVRSADRWASVRSDDRGRELRMGERRAAMHSDESGTEMRIEDRWAAVLRRESSRPEPTPDTGGDSGFWSESRWDESRGDNRWTETRRERRGGASQPALPASVEPASRWTKSSSAPDEKTSDRWSRDDEGDDFRAWRSSGAESRPRRALDDDEPRTRRRSADDEPRGVRRAIDDDEPRGRRRAAETWSDDEDSGSWSRTGDDSVSWSTTGRRPRYEESGDRWR